MTGRAREHGAALLAVLLLVAVMAALAAVALERSQIATRLAGNIASLDQARAFATGAEALAITRIELLTAQSPRKTTLDGDWLGRESLLPLPDNGIASARVFDGGNCFNLNSVASGNGPLALQTNFIGIEQFVALMQAIEIPERDARQIALALGDWIDSDTAVSRGGAEDGAYRDADTPYRTANTLIAEPSELRAIQGMTEEYYERLRPWVCALPDTRLSPVNVNTVLPEQAPLLAMLLPARLDLARATQIIADRPAGGWNSVSDFWAHPVLAALEPAPEIVQQVDIRTTWFRLELAVQYGGADLEQGALIDASIVPARVVARRWGAEI